MTNQTNHRKTTLAEDWDAPWARFDYDKLEADARRECEALQKRLNELRRQQPKSWDEELLLRRRVRMLTSMYYEQRQNRIFFGQRAAQRRAAVGAAREGQANLPQKKRDKQRPF